MATDTDSALQTAMNGEDDSTSAAQPVSASPQQQDSSTSTSDQGSNLQALASTAPDASQLPPAQGTLAQTFGAATAPNVFAPSQAPLKGLGGRLRGVLYGLATGNVPGMIAGAIDPNDARARYQQRQAIRQAQADTAQATAASAVQNVQFESVRAADSHIQASKQAERIDQLKEESRATVRQLNDQHEKFLMDEFGIMPDLSIEGNGQEVHDQATGGLSTLAKENEGLIPPVAANIQPHTANQPKFKIGVYAPSLQDLQKNSAGYRDLVNTARTVQGLGPIDDLSWSSGMGNGFRGQRQMALDAMQFLSPVQQFTEQNLPSVLASRKQMLAAYEKHMDASGNADADPAVVSQLKASVDFLQNAQDDMAKSKSQSTLSSGPLTEDLARTITTSPEGTPGVTPERRKQAAQFVQQVQQDRMNQATAQAKAEGKGTEAMYQMGTDPISHAKLNLANAPDEFLVDSRSGQPIPLRLMTTMGPDMTEKNRADFAGSVIHSLDQIDQLRTAGKLPNGPIQGLTEKALAKAGMGSSDAQAALNFISFAQSASTGAHVGGRFSLPVLQKMSDLVKLNMNDSQFSGAEASIRNVMNQYVQQGGRESVAQYKERVLSAPPVKIKGKLAKAVGFDKNGQVIMQAVQ